MKHWRQITGFLIGVAVTPFALIAAVASAGAGHGTFLFAKLLFPYSMLLTTLTADTITRPLVALACVQFPLYGLVATSLSSRRPILGLAALHATCAAACLSGILPNFS